jgi:type I restriction enzyme S subunit
MRKYVTLGDVCIKGSSNIAQKDLENNNGTYAIYGASGYIKNVNFYHQDMPYIAVVKDGAGIGRTMLLPEKTSVIGTLQYLIPNDSVSVKYLYYAVTYMNLSKYFTGATIPHIYFKDYRKELLPLPPMEKQQEIADRLEKVDAVIELCNSIMEKMDVLVKSRFMELFGDPAGNPKGWTTLSFKQAGVRLSDGPFGSNLKSEHYTTEGVRVIRLGNIGVGCFIDKDKSFVSTEHYERLKKYTCKAGEIVIGTLGEPNLRACIIPENVGYAINKADCVHYIPKAEILDSRFVCQYINCPETLHLAAGMIHGQTRSRISSGQIAEMPIFIPPIELQNQFAAFVREIDKSKSTVQKRLNKLQTLQKSLMQQYFG